MNNPHLPNGPFGMLKPKKESERRIHTRVAKFMRENYPHARFYTSLDGEYMSPHQREHQRALQWGRGFPDLLILWPNVSYNGLAIELKKDSADPYKKDGELKAGEHLKEQSEWLEYFSDIGWLGKFGVGYDNTIDIITNYMKHTL